MSRATEEKEMQRAFRTQTAEILREPERFQKDGDHLRIGLESEIAVWKPTATIEEQGIWRDRILADLKAMVICDVELGASQIEFRTPVYDLHKSQESILPAYEEYFQKVLRVARSYDVLTLRSGTNPFLPIFDTPRSAEIRYQRVPDFHNCYRRKPMETRIGFMKTPIDVGDAGIISLFQAFQINLETMGLEDAIDKMNRALMLGPFFLTIAGNARYLELTDTGFNDIRLLAWEISHDTRTQEEIRQGMRLRIGLPENYFRDLAQYFDRIARYPFILYDPGHALKIGIGLHWLDTRIKFIDNSAVIELRVLPTQPTPQEEIALTLFFIGRLLHSQNCKETLLPISYVQENRIAAILHGISANLWFWTPQGKLLKAPARDVLRIEIERAERELNHRGFDANLLQLLAKRISYGSPSILLATRLGYRRYVMPNEMRDALIATKMLY